MVRAGQAGRQAGQGRAEQGRARVGRIRYTYEDIGVPSNAITLGYLTNVWLSVSHGKWPIFSACGRGGPILIV